MEIDSGLILPELNYADIAGICKVPVEHYGRYGGVIPTPVEILDALKKMIK